MNISSLGYKVQGEKAVPIFSKVISRDVGIRVPSIPASSTAISADGYQLLGVKFGDQLVILPPTDKSTKGLIMNGFVDSENRVKLIYQNPTDAAIDLGNTTVHFQAFRR